MAAVTDKQLRTLRPYLQGEKPKQNGEWDMHCPLHIDGNRSASLNVEKGVWICYYGCGAGTVARLMRMQDDWVEPTKLGSGPSSSGSRSAGASLSANAPTSAHVAGWSSALLSANGTLDDFLKARALDRDTLRQHLIGYDSGQKAYTIPVFGPEGEIQNVRFYQLKPQNDRRKIWSVANMGRPQLYPLNVLEADPREIVICEGELDALATNQRGIPAITRTASATTWDVSWNQAFKGRRVYVIQDTDEAGVMGTNKLRRALQGVAEAVVPVRLPYKITKKHGKDLTDFFKDGYTADDLRELMREADAKYAPERPEDLDPTDASILETLDSLRVGKPQRVTATVRGKLEPGYSVPRQVELSCSMDRGEQVCSHCPLYGARGRAKVEIPPNDPDVLGLIDATKLQVTEIVREKYGALKCNRLTHETLEYQAVETLYVRPSVDHVRFAQAADFQSRKITSVGKHDTSTNTTVQITGALYPDPRRQRNEFLAWNVEEQVTSLDKFVLDENMREALRVFQPARGQSPLAKRVEIAKELAREVTGIHRRDEMHVAMDLVFHSALSFVLDGQVIDRGWVELLVVGDTRTGKSECALHLTEHYQVGEIVDCKAASFAGVVGGLQQFAGSGEYTVNWGIVPMNDRRLVVMEEASGLQPEEIAQLSSVRSSGVAKITKIQQDSTSARTRLLWLANPRNSDMSQYLHGVDAIKPIIGNDEDLARFTLAMAVRKGEVPLEVINGPSQRTGQLQYKSDLCHALVMWCWSRRREQIRFTQQATAAVYKQANRLGNRYTETPPLVQAANVRVKIASLAVALAGSTFSTDEDGENVIVTHRHVQDAARFMDHVYAMPSFGYLERSLEARRDDELAKRSLQRASKMLKNNPGLGKFLRMQTKFKRQDIEEVLNYNRDGANSVINELHEMRMIQKQGGFVVVSPVLHEILRGNQ